MNSKGVPSGLTRGRPVGFTLIELMIVVAIIAVLAAISYPAYQQHVQKTRRAQAKADLIEYAQLAERFHTVNNTYVGFDLPVDFSPREGGVAFYGLELAGVDQDEYTITATPVEGTRQADDKCGALSIDQAGIKTHGGGSENNGECQFGTGG
ncbi:type IV pilin protein [Luteimonas suaedae]|uniref:type IV pilin protein n=1 Tax=Luteimonas suaedae TaxID=2605430 RepID=UPI0011EE56AA|nr:type IV pilin protein [Luteimonas suaedae]